MHDGGDIEVPEVARGMIRDRLAAAGLFCEWSEAHVSLSGRIELTDARVGPAGGDAVFEAGRLVTELDVFDLIFAGRFTPRRLWLDRGRLVCPAVLSPSGRPEVALDEVRASLRREGDRLVVGTLQARCSGVPLVAHGRLFPSIAQLSSGAASKAASGTAHPLRAPGLAAARLVALRPTLALLEGASLELSGEDVTGGVKLSLDGLADAIRFRGVEMSAVRLHCRARWADSGPHPEGRATFAIGGLQVNCPATGDGSEAISARTGAAALRMDFGRDWEVSDERPDDRPQPRGERLSAGRAGSTLRCDWSGVSPSGGRGRRALGTSTTPRRQGVAGHRTGEIAATLAAHARAPLSELGKYPAFPKGLAEKRPDLSTSPASSTSAAPSNSAARYAFENAALRLDAGRTRFGAIDVPAFTVAADITPDRVFAHDIDAYSAEQRVRGSFETGSSSSTGPTRRPTGCCCAARPTRTRSGRLSATGGIISGKTSPSRPAGRRRATSRSPAGGTGCPTSSFSAP